MTWSDLEKQVRREITRRNEDRGTRQARNKARETRQSNVNLRFSDQVDEESPNQLIDRGRKHDRMEGVLMYYLIILLEYCVLLIFLLVRANLARVTSSPNSTPRRFPSCLAFS